MEELFRQMRGKSRGMVSMKHVFSEEIFEPEFELEGPHLVEPI